MSKKNFNFDQKWDASAYEEHGIPQFEIALDALSNWNFDGIENILDIGCGDGAVTFLIAKKFAPNAKVVGIDLSKDMIDLAKKTYNESHLSFENIGANQISFQDKFDLVFSFYCFHWIQDQQDAINKIAKSLRSGGKLLIYTMTTSTLLSKLFSELVQSNELKQYFQGSNFKLPLNLKNIEDFEKMLNEAGLKKISVEKVDKEIIFKDKQEFNEWVSSLPLAKGLPKELQKEAISKFCMHYLKELKINQDGPVKFYLPTLIIKSQKI